MKCNYLRGDKWSAHKQKFFMGIGVQELFITCIGMNRDKSVIEMKPQNMILTPVTSWKSWLKVLIKRWKRLVVNPVYWIFYTATRWLTNTYVCCDFECRGNEIFKFFSLKIRTN